MGDVHGDAVRDALGTLLRVGGGHNSVVSGDGVFAVSGSGGQAVNAGGQGNLSTVVFALSRVQPTGPANAPRRWGALACCYLGTPAS